MVHNKVVLLPSCLATSFTIISTGGGGGLRSAALFKSHTGRVI